MARRGRTRFRKGDGRDPVLWAEHLVQDDGKSVNILNTDLKEKTAGIGEESTSVCRNLEDGVHVRMEPVDVRITKGLTGWGLNGSIGTPTLASTRLVVAREVDAVRRVEEDHLDLTGHALLGGQRGHHVNGIAADDPVRPVALELVPVVLRIGRKAVELGKPVHLFGVSLGTGQLLDERRGIDLLMDVEGQRVALNVANGGSSAPAEQGAAGSRRLGRKGHALASLVVHEDLISIGRNVGTPRGRVLVGLRLALHHAPRQARVMASRASSTRSTHTARHSP